MHRVGGAKLPIYQFQFEAIDGPLQYKKIVQSKINFQLEIVSGYFTDTT